MSHYNPQKPEDSEETKKWERQKQDEAQRSKKEDKKETERWEAEKDVNREGDQESE